MSSLGGFGFIVGQLPLSPEVHLILNVPFAQHTQPKDGDFLNECGNFRSELLDHSYPHLSFSVLREQGWEFLIGQVSLWSLRLELTSILVTRTEYGKKKDA